MERYKRVYEDEKKSKSEILESINSKIDKIKDLKKEDMETAKKLANEIAEEVKQIVEQDEEEKETPAEDDKEEVKEEAGECDKPEQGKDKEEIEEKK